MDAEFVAGSVSGCASIVVGQPFDTIKVRLQTGGRLYRNAVHCLQRTLKSEGPAGLFRGMASPLATASVVNAVVFSTYAETLRLLSRTSDSHSEAIFKQFAAGAFAGAVQCSILTPAELVKCRLQVQTSARYTGPVDCLRSIIRTHGLKGVYQGLGATMAREVPAFGLYFGTYELMKEQFIQRYSWSTFHASMLAGGVSGTLGWAALYPVDYAKSIIQTLPSDAPREQRGVIQTLRRTIVLHGPRYIFRGLGATMCRAFVVNATIFPVYEAVLQAISHPMREVPRGTDPEVAAAAAVTV